MHKLREQVVFGHSMVPPTNQQLGATSTSQLFSQKNSTITRIMDKQQGIPK